MSGDRTPESGPSSTGADVPGWVLDVLLGLAVAIVVTIGVVSGPGVARPVGAFVLAGVFGALMVLRRRFPVLVLIITAVLICVYYALDYPEIGLALPMAAALYSAAEARRLLPASLVAAVLILLSLGFRLSEGTSPGVLFGYELATTVTLMAAALALGDGTRSRRELRRLGELREQQTRERAERERAEERLALARELHDDLGHNLSVISLHAASAAEASADDPATVRASLGLVRRATSDALGQLRGTVKVLRRPGELSTAVGSATLDDLDRIVTTLRQAGLEVEQPTALPDVSRALSAVGYRIVQEAATNVIKHAHASRVIIEVEQTEQSLQIRIADDGRGLPESTDSENDHGAGAESGHGLPGLTERAAALGGHITIESSRTGTTVTATLPTTDAARPTSTPEAARPEEPA